MFLHKTILQAGKRCALGGRSTSRAGLTLLAEPAKLSEILFTTIL